ncbi:queuosine precursor transporter [Rubeoparvulum massiliense]|uniref:queuosine precursor transporter n=1 Tax=Rubeoparvulum massiliense TaxID=1631346 RepID=UPI00065E4774|nr:queuosine precursor transporter [Rubeoparvulum massiliense]
MNPLHFSPEYANVLYWFILLIVNFSAIILAFKWFGKTGLYFWIAIAAIIANLQVVKTVDFFFVVATLGNIVYGTSYLATDILSEIYGKKAAAKGVQVGFFTLLSTMIIMQIVLWFIPAADDFAHESLLTIFGFMPRIVIASLLAYLISQRFDIWAFEKWREHFPGDRYLWLRNNGSTMISQLIDTLVFTTVAFIGVYPTDVFIDIIITTYVIKWFVALLDTPFVYLARNLFRRGQTFQEEFQPREEYQ